ncbi:unnamed protein product [Didymodactylos carnosus]|uniref:NAD(P)(+)--arginine ADP-ribosyltransferase n=1 Tax=Didymodactylos carnosus TaxID=1234261 RepID=A0A815VF58_9BILA|nr:unnamed protein product [Didymodactylos carnosus]CAF1529715.1 unnamed protein product [Didymodactylos carnosus]CAF4272777.1 unnamed protein product [Didymodactylos carnosus]CAF4388911.1 unnamed protein product [Didymodactylos carnosus]
MGNLLQSLKEYVYNRREQSGRVPVHLNRFDPRKERTRNTSPPTTSRSAERFIQSKERDNQSCFGETVHPSLETRPICIPCAEAAITNDKSLSARYLYPDPHAFKHHSASGGSGVREEPENTNFCSWEECSPFYRACRENKIDDVKEFLRTMTPEEIDKMEPNGSTALHVACYYGNIEIVRLLLDADADRGITNKFKCLPYDEAATDEIKALFIRVPTSNRLVSNTGAVEWVLIDDDVLEKAAEDRGLIKYAYDTNISNIDKMFDRIQKNYVDKVLRNSRGIDGIKRYFEVAKREKNPIHIVKAYTAETDFYSLLNIELAGGSSIGQYERRYILALLMYHPVFEKFSYAGLAYRGMMLTETDVEQYLVGCSLMMKSFLSSSIDRKIAEAFLLQYENMQSSIGLTPRLRASGKLVKFSAICTYLIRHRRTGLYIEELSQYANEGEVLIMPHTVFKVKKVDWKENLINILLEECDPYQSKQ